MNIIEKGNINIEQLIRKKDIKDKCLFRLSNFAYLFSDSRHHLIRFTLTNSVMELTDKEWQFVNSLRDSEITGGELQERGLSYLAENCIFVEHNFDEYKRYALVRDVLKTMSSKKSGRIKSYTILPSTACNARCVYCYEEGMTVRTMAPEIADRTVDFICRTKRDEKIELSWFGGEPLLSKNIISRICSTLNERNVSFSSRITTNGTLFTKELVKYAKDSWHLIAAQVSADGSRKDYELRKNYYNPSAHNYESMLNSITYLLNDGIKVSVRCNYDSENVNGIMDFLEDIYSRFGICENLSIYFALLFQTRDTQDSIETQKKVIDIIRYFRGKGMKSVVVLDRAYRMRVNFCMADSGSKHVVIDPEGFLYHCEHLPSNAAFGNISDEELVFTSDPRALMSVNSQCRQCCFLPYCTPFFRNGCPTWSRQCYESKRVEMDFLLEQVIQNKICNKEAEKQ